MLPESLQRSSAIAGSSLVATAQGLMYLDSLCDGLQEGEIRQLPDIELIGPHEQTFSAQAVCCFGERSSYRVDLTNGMALRATYSHKLPLDPGNGQIEWQSIEQLNGGEIIALPLMDYQGCFGPNLLESRHWQLDYYAQGMSPTILAGTRSSLMRFIEMVLATSDDETNTCRSSLKFNDNNEIALCYTAPSLIFARQLQLLLYLCFQVITQVVRTDLKDGELIFDGKALAQLSQSTDVVGLLAFDHHRTILTPVEIKKILQLYEPGYKDRHHLTAAVAEIKSIRRRPMYNFLTTPARLFWADGTWHWSLDPEKLDLDLTAYTTEY